MARKKKIRKYAKKIHTVRKKRSYRKRVKDFSLPEYREWILNNSHLSVKKARELFPFRFNVLVNQKAFDMAFLRLTGKIVPKHQKAKEEKMLKDVKSTGVMKLDVLSEKKVHYFQICVDGEQILDITPHGKHVNAIVQLNGTQFRFTVDKD